MLPRNLSYDRRPIFLNEYSQTQLKHNLERYNVELRHPKANSEIQTYFSKITNC